MFIFKPKPPSGAELRQLRKRGGYFRILHPAIAEKAFGKDAVIIAENDPTGYVGSDDRFDYYLGQQIPIKFIKNKPNGNRNKTTSCRAKNKK
jgi:hypothetical protein